MDAFDSIEQSGKVELVEDRVEAAIHQHERHKHRADNVPNKLVLLCCGQIELGWAVERDQRVLRDKCSTFCLEFVKSQGDKKFVRLALDS